MAKGGATNNKDKDISFNLLFLLSKALTKETVEIHMTLCLLATSKELTINITYPENIYPSVDNKAQANHAIPLLGIHLLDIPA